MPSERENVRRAQRSYRTDKYIADRAAKQGQTSIADQVNARLRDTRKELSKYN